MTDPNHADYAALLDAFSDPHVQWAVRSDWQGLCPLRHTHGCEGTDGKLSGAGMSRPKPHGEHCPFRLLAEPHTAGVALVEEVRRLRTQNQVLRELLAPVVAWVGPYKDPARMSLRERLKSVVGPELSEEHWCALRDAAAAEP